VVRHRIEIPEERMSASRVEDSEMDYETQEEVISKDEVIPEDEDDEKDSGVTEWLKEWRKREAISGKIQRIMT
jgi:hypothetical protein